MAKAKKATFRSAAEAYRCAITDAIFTASECEYMRPKRSHRNGVHWHKGYSVGVRQTIKVLTKLRKG